MDQLPIHDLLAPLQQAFIQHNQVILQAPTGSGKSTALPLAMLDWQDIQGRIILLEPRRVAARSIAHYLAKCRGQDVGEDIGFRVRGESKIGKNTRLEIVTEGVLTRMIQRDPELTGIGMVVFDEIHERHLTTDLGLALTLEVQLSLREDLKLLAMSATLQGIGLADLMPDAVQLESLGRTFPVEQLYRAPKSHTDWLEHAGKQIAELLDVSSPLAQAINSAVLSSLSSPSPSQSASASASASQAEPAISQGSILVFLPGQAEIKRLQRYLAQRLGDRPIDICPLYGAMTIQEQERALSVAATGRRKIVLATNIAESSLTIEGITLVVDCGFVRQANFNPKTGVTLLETKRISEASAVQRAGRAGRITHGVCLRLWSQEEQGRLIKNSQPEILTSELLSMALDGAYWGVKSLNELALLTVPAAVNETLAWSLLASLGMVDATRKITSHGQAAYELGCDPRLAHMLLQSEHIDQQEQIESANQVTAYSQPLFPLACMLAALLEARGLPKLGADIGLYLSLASQGPVAKQARRWLSLRLSQQASRVIDFKQIARYADHSHIGLLLALAYPDRIAKRRGIHGYRLANGTGVQLMEQDSLVAQEWLAVADFQQLQGRSSGQIYLAAPLSPKLFETHLAGQVTNKDIVGWDEQTGKFVAERQLSVGHIPLSKRTLTSPTRVELNQAILELIKQQGLTLLEMGDDVIQLQTRVALARELQPNEAWPDLSEHRLMQTLATWLLPYLDKVSSVSQLKKLDCLTLLKHQLTWECQQSLNRLLPTHWPLATGTKARIHYEPTARALMRVKLQETFGMAQSPVVANGQLSVTLELLSPAQRPLALTADLANFWQGPYQEVKKEMRGRYPKHLWPDDPATTLPTKFTKKRTQQGQQ